MILSSRNIELGSHRVIRFHGIHRTPHDSTRSDWIPQDFTWSHAISPDFIGFDKVYCLTILVKVCVAEWADLARAIEDACWREGARYQSQLRTLQVAVDHIETKQNALKSTGASSRKLAGVAKALNNAHQRRDMWITARWRTICIKKSGIRPFYDWLFVVVVNWLQPVSLDSHDHNTCGLAWRGSSRILFLACPVRVLHGTGAVIPLSGGWDWLPKKFEHFWQKTNFCYGFGGDCLGQNIRNDSGTTSGFHHKRDFDMCCACQISLVKQFISFWRTDIWGVIFLRIYNWTCSFVCSSKYIPCIFMGFIDFYGFSQSLIDFNGFWLVLVDLHGFL